MSLEYYWIDLDGSINHCDSAEQAKREAEAQIEAARDESYDVGWPEDVTGVEWGIVCEEARVTSCEPSEDERFDEIVDYALRGTGVVWPPRRSVSAPVDVEEYNYMAQQAAQAQQFAAVAAALGVDPRALVEDPSIARTSVARAEKAERERDRYRAAIVDAMKQANGRWDEWGERALGVADILGVALERDEAVAERDAMRERCGVTTASMLVAQSERECALARAEAAEREQDRMREDMQSRRVHLDNGRTVKCPTCGEVATGVCTHLAGRLYSGEAAEPAALAKDESCTCGRLAVCPKHEREMGW